MVKAQILNKADKVKHIETQRNEMKDNDCSARVKGRIDGSLWDTIVDRGGRDKYEKAQDRAWAFRTHRGYENGLHMSDDGLTEVSGRESLSTFHVVSEVRGYLTIGDSAFHTLND